MTVAGHSLDVIAVEGNYVTRTPASSIALYIGSRYDAILTADQASSSWPRCRPPDWDRREGR